MVSSATVTFCLFLLTTENAKKAAEAKLHRKLERQAAIEAAKQAKLRKGNRWLIHVQGRWLPA